MMSTESGQHEARLSPEEAAAASLAATRIKLGTAGFHEYAQCTVQALESAVPETEAGMRCLAGQCSFAVCWRGAFGTVPPYVCAYTKTLYRLLCAESTAPEILKKGETVPHAQAL